MLQQRKNTPTADNDDVTQEKSHQQEDNDRLPDDENVISFPPAGEWTELRGGVGRGIRHQDGDQVDRESHP